MNDINTNIDDYNNNEILELFNIENRYLNVDSLTDKVQEILASINNITDNNIDINELSNFFKKCYLRICVSKGYNITDKIKKLLQLPTIEPLPVIENFDNNIINTHNITNNKIIQQNHYEGSLNKENIVHIEDYARGYVNPLHRQSFKKVVILNSKFNRDYNGTYTTISGGVVSVTNKSDSTMSQSDRLRIKTLAYNTNRRTYNLITQTNNCDNVTTDVSINNLVDFTFTLDKPYTNVISMKLGGFAFMNSYYPISEYLGTNELKIITFDYDPSGTPPESTIANEKTYTIYLDDGYYPSNIVATYLNGIINYYGISNPDIKGVTCQYESITGKFNFFMDPSFADVSGSVPPRKYGFNLDFTYSKDIDRPLYLNFGWLLGYRMARYNYFNDLQQISIYNTREGFISESNTNTIGTKFFFVEIDDFNNNNSATVHYNNNSVYSYNIKNIIAKLPNVSDLNTILYDDLSDKNHKERIYYGPVTIEKLRIRLLDENGQVIYSHGNDVVITLELECLNSPYKNLTNR